MIHFLSIESPLQYCLKNLIIPFHLTTFLKFSDVLMLHPHYKLIDPNLIQELENQFSRDTRQVTKNMLFWIYIPIKFLFLEM